MWRATTISVLLAQPLASAWLDASWRPRRCALRAEADGSSWRPDVVDPLGKVWGAPAKKSRPYGYWLDLRAAENTFAQMVVVKLFYAVRKIVDEAGRALADGEQILVGGNERYVSLCRLHFRRAMKMPGCEECATPAPGEKAAKPSVGVDATLALDLDDLADAAAGGSPEM